MMHTLAASHSLPSCFACGVYSSTVISCFHHVWVNNHHKFSLPHDVMRQKYKGSATLYILCSLPHSFIDFSHNPLCSKISFQQFPLLFLYFKVWEYGHYCLLLTCLGVSFQLLVCLFAVTSVVQQWSLNKFFVAAILPSWCCNYCCVHICKLLLGCFSSLSSRLSFGHRDLGFHS